MEYEQKEIIYDYFRLGKAIRNKEKQLSYDKTNFYNQNFCGSTDFDDPKGIRFRGFRLDIDMTYFIDNVAAAERTIQKMKFKNKYFGQFLRTLNQDMYSSLERRYRINSGGIEDILALGSDMQVIEEILEIEEAVCYKFKGDIELFELTKLQIAPLNNDTLEDSFSAITELLGV